MTWPKSSALRAKAVQRILDTTQHSLDRELSHRTMCDGFDLVGGGVLIVFEDGKGRLYPSKVKLLAALEGVEEKGLPGPVRACSGLPQGQAFAEQVLQLISGLPAQLKLDPAQLDGTEASLDAVDKALHRMSHQRMLNPDVWAALTAYVGEVIRIATTGRWEMRRASDSEKTWEPWIVDSSGRSYAPFKIYKELLEYGSSCSLRVFVHWELAHGMQNQ